MKEIEVVEKLLSDAVENSDAETQYALGYCYKGGITVKYNPDEAIKCFRKAAEKGNKKESLYDALSPWLVSDLTL